jgi:hypothetical protein
MGKDILYKKEGFQRYQLVVQDNPVAAVAYHIGKAKGLPDVFRFPFHSRPNPHK